jgi:hypothetical protein
MDNWNVASRLRLINSYSFKKNKNKKRQKKRNKLAYLPESVD